MLSIKSLFDAFHIWMTIGCGFMENVTQPAGNLALSHIVRNSDVIESRKLSLRQVSTKYQPPIMLTLNANMPSKNVIYQHMQSPIMLVSSCIYDTYVRSGQSVNRTNMKGQRSHLAYSGHHASVSALSALCLQQTLQYIPLSARIGLR